MRCMQLGTVGLVAGLAFSSVLAGRLGAAEPAPEVPIQCIRNVPYVEGTNADPVKHKLDLFLPKDRTGFPVLFFVHGGAWTHGDKSFFGVYSSLGKALARHGIGTVVTNYRLSPGVVHPEHIKDIARAFAWTYRHIAEYGGRPDEIFVCGHSAGGHLIALLATDDSYLKAVGLTLAAIRGAIPMSGVYEIPAAGFLFNLVFGSDVQVHERASPLAHVRGDGPPFLILYAAEDLSYCGKAPSEAFCKAIRDKKGEAQTMEIGRRNHLTLILNACVERDPVATAVLKFIADHLPK
jgi:acetyl esterase/lipase